MKSPIKVLAVLPGFIPSTIIGVVQPLLDLQARQKVEFHAALDLLPSSSNVGWADVVIFCRNVELKHRAALDAVLRQGKPFVYELDDNLFEVTGDTDITTYHRAPERQAMLAEYVRRANLVRVYADPVLERCRAMNPNTVKVFAPVDWRVAQPGKKTERVKIVYATSRDSDELWKMFWPGLRRILLEFPDQVEATFWGPQLAAEKLPNLHFLPPVFDYNRYLRLFSGKGFDIGLAPLPDDPFHRSKTNNKFREYSISKIAGIYSDVSVYAEWVRDGETGLLVGEDPEAWYQALRRLVVDPTLRERIQEQSYAYVRENFSPEVFAEVWFEHLTRVLEQPIREVAQEPLDASQASMAAGPRGGKLAFVQRALRRFARVFQESPQKTRRLVGWLVFNVWALVRVNRFKKI